MVAAPQIAVVVPPVVAVAPPAPLDACRPTVLSVQFDTAKFDIKPEYAGELKRLADFLKQFPAATGEIAGHTDNAGREKFNQRLSLDRAESVRNYLVKNFGIDPKRITVKGYGPTRPIADNDTEEGKRQNRRIETNFSCEPAPPGAAAEAPPKAEAAPVPAAEAAPQGAAEPDLQQALQRLDADLGELPKRSAQLARLAWGAHTGNPKAYVSLGWYYRKGIELPLDVQQGLAWYRLSALKGNMDAQVALGWLYATGEGVKKNTDEAVMWYNKAAAQGSGKAKAMLKKLVK